MGFLEHIFSQLCNHSLRPMGLTIQFTAAIGLMVPIISIITLYARKRKFLLKEEAKKAAAF